MDDKSSETIDMRFKNLKKELSETYKIFMEANENLSKISFENLPKQNEEMFNPEMQTNFAPKDVNEILAAGSVDDSLKALRSKLEKSISSGKETPLSAAHQLFNKFIKD